MTLNTTYKSIQHIYRHNKYSRIRYWFFGLMILFSIILFLPWTQNIRAKGTVTTLRQEQRPQQLNPIIPGKIIKWHVKEGDFVKAGDTLIQLAEIKDEYFDPNLLNRTQEQLKAKELTVDFYQNKVNATQSQVTALNAARDLKLEQLQNKLQQLHLKVQSDSMEFVAAVNDFKIATLQYNRQKAMYDSGLVSLTQLEQRNQSYQNAMAKKISAENKFANTKQDLTITRIEMNSVQQDYIEKISKAQGDQFQSLSEIAGSRGEIAKLQNQYSNYNIRSSLYYITAPQSGQITKAKKSGIGEIVKDGEMLVEIVPDKIQYAVEMFVRPVDLPLITAGQKVSLLFDG
ncbi:MAG TPA: HlyD family efflux transporter periplasmic adaptor subunit, partial [Chitinophagaceae bacterium]